MKRLLGIELKILSKKSILEKIEKYTSRPRGFFHIVSVNPENVVIAQKNLLFKEVVDKAQIQLMDGIGVVAAGRMLGIEIASRLTGVDLMENLLQVASDRRLRVVLIGGKGNLANYLANCYNKAFSEAKFVGFGGIKNIKKPTMNEEKEVLSIITSVRPHFLFVAFGSPDQELWLWKNKAKLQGIVCVGVGGGFDFLAGKIRRAPKFIRKIGLEWLWRLILQPWRLKRQLRLIEFVWLVLKQRLLN